MANYKDIHGTNIETVTSDPDNPVNGQVWYNSTEQALKGFTSNPAGTWATTSALNTGRYQLAGCGKSSTGALAIGGSPPPAPAAKGNTESWNGTSWTEVNDLNTSRANAVGIGTYTSAIASGGDGLSGTTETWNGSSWSNVTSSPISGNSSGGAGADSEDALIFGGSPQGNTATAAHWNGSSWTAAPSLNTARANLSGVGATYTAALAVGGFTNPSTRKTEVEKYDGSSWTEVSDINTARGGLSSSGEVTSGLAYGGDESPASAKTENWNGSSWTETGDLNTARAYLMNSGSGADSTAAIVAGGTVSGPDLNASEQFVSPTTSTVTFTAS